MNIAFHHICIETDKYAESIAFYKNIFDFKIIEELKNFHGREFNTWLKKNDVIIELQTPNNDISSGKCCSGNTGLIHVCFSVENLDEAVSKIKEFAPAVFKDGKEKYQINGRYISKITAPEGTIIELRQ